jgi:hypothetical protein
VVTAQKSHRSTDLDNLIDQMEGLTQSYQKVVIQWVPAHWEIQGNEEADKLDKKGGALQQEDLGSTYEVAKSYIKCHLSSKWEKDHRSHQKGDSYHQLPRHAQVTILRLLWCVVCFVSVVCVWWAWCVYGGRGVCLVGVVCLVGGICVVFMVCGVFSVNVVCGVCLWAWCVW